MADPQDKFSGVSSDGGPSENTQIQIGNDEIWKFGHNGGAPKPRTKSIAPKPWQPPKNESTPTNRVKST